MKEEGNEQSEREEKGASYATHARTQGQDGKKRARDQGTPRASQAARASTVGGEGPRKVVMCHPKTPGGCAADTVVRFAGVGMVQERTVRAIESVEVCQWAGDTAGETRVEVVMEAGRASIVAACHACAG